MSTSSSASSKSSSASRSSSAAAASRSAATSSSAPKAATSKAATSKPADTKSCHLADPSQTQKLRSELDKFAKQYPSSYSSKVQSVNGWMQGLGVGISPCSQQSIKGSLKGVNQGTMSEKQAHEREATSFAKDAFESYARGNISQGVWESVGAGLNTAAAQVARRSAQPTMPVPSVSGPLVSGGGGGGGGGRGW